MQVLTLGAAFLYSLASLFFKKGFENGVSLAVTLFCSNLLMAVAFFPLFFLQTEPVDWSMVHAPVVNGLLFFGGQALTLAAMWLGDISLMTPILGTKIIFVAIGVSVAGHSIPTSVLGAAGIATVAVILLGLTDVKRGAGNLQAIMAALGSSLFFSVNDVLMQDWALRFGGWAFIAMMFISVGLFSFCLVPFFRTSWRSITATGWSWLGGGSALFSCQCLMMAVVFGFYQRAALANVLFSTRGLWSIALIWLIGPLIGNWERDIGPWKMSLRLVGAILVTGAVVIVI